MALYDHNTYDFDGIANLSHVLIAHAQKLETYISGYVATYTPQVLFPCARTNEAGVMRFEAVLYNLQSTLGVLTSSIERARGSLRRCRNALINVNTLPEEILRCIFFKAARTSIVNKDHLSKACWRWRTVCLSFPRLWAEFNTPGYSPCLLRRTIALSQRLPLTVSVDANILFLPARDLLFQHLADIQRLKIVLPTRQSQREEWLQADYPLLHELHLQATGSFFDDIVPPLSGRAGNLRRLFLRNCRFPYSPHNYRLFHALTITSDCADDDHRADGPGDGSFLRSLSVCQEIEELTLYNPPMSMQEVEARSQHRPSSSVRLPGLRKLDISMAVQKASLFIASLATSETSLQSVRVVLTTWNGRREPSVDLSQLFVLPSPECLPMLERLHTLSICHERSVSGSLFASGRSMPSAADPESFHVNFGENTDELLQLAFDNFLHSMFRHHRFHGLRVLRLERVPTAAILDVLHVVPALEALVISACPSPAEVFCALMISDAADNAAVNMNVSDASNSRVVPRLRALTLAKSTLGKGDVVAISQLLEQCAIRELTFERCTSEWQGDDVIRFLAGRSAGIAVRWL